MTTLYLIRHGQASFGRENYDRLSPRGLLQMKILGGHLAGTGCLVQAVYCGPLERQRASAAEVVRRCRELNMRLPCPDEHPDLAEYDYQAVLAAQLPDMIAADPSMERALDKVYHDETAFQKVFEQAVMRWVSGRHDKAGTETWADFSARVHQALRDICSAHGNGGAILVFTSGGVITAALQAALGMTAQRAVSLGWRLFNASVTRLSCRAKKLDLTGFNDIAHLELRRDRTLLTFR